MMSNKQGEEAEQKLGEKLYIVLINKLKKYMYIYQLTKNYKSCQERVGIRRQHGSVDTFQSSTNNNSKY